MTSPLGVVNETFTTYTACVSDGLVVLALMAFQQPLVGGCVVTVLASPCFVFVDSGMLGQMSLAKVTFATAWICSYCRFDPTMGELVNFQLSKEMVTFTTSTEESV